MSLDRINHGELHSYLPNVPLIHLSRLQTSNWSFIENHESSDYFYSISYLNDALNVSSWMPITSHRYSPCSLDISHNSRPKKDDQQINLKRIKQIIFGNHLKIDQTFRCTKQQTHIDNKLRKKENSTQPKKLPVTTQRRYLPKKCQHMFNTPLINPNSSHVSTPRPPLPIKNMNNSPLNIISHTRFGKSMLALYFQKYRYISPIDNTHKKEQFLKLNQSIK